MPVSDSANLSLVRLSRQAAGFHRTASFVLVVAAAAAAACIGADLVASGWVLPSSCEVDPASSSAAVLASSVVAAAAAAGIVDLVAAASAASYSGHSSYFEEPASSSFVVVLEVACIHFAVEESSIEALIAFHWPVSQRKAAAAAAAAVVVAPREARTLECDWCGPCQLCYLWCLGLPPYQDYPVAAVGDFEDSAVVAWYFPSYCCQLHSGVSSCSILSGDTVPQP